MYSGLGHAIMRGLVKPRMRAVMSALALFMMNIIGFGLGPILVGMLSDHSGSSEGQANTGLLGIQSATLALLFFMAWAVLHYVLGARTYARDLEAKKG